MAVMLPDHLRSMKDILLNFTMFPGLLGAESVDGAYWTLAVEMLFYIITAIITLLPGIKWRKAGLGAWITTAAFVFFCTKVGMRNLPVKVIGVLGLADSRFEFLAVGTLLALLLKEEGNKRLPMYAGLILCGVVAWMRLGLIYGLLWLIITLAFIFLSVNIVIPSAFTKNVFLKMMESLAKISYPVYLIHQYVGRAILKNLDASGLTSEIYIVIPICVSLLLGILLHIFVEVPSARFLLGKK